MDLPLPDGPRSATLSPAATVSDVSRRAGGPSSYLRLTPRTSINDVVMYVPLGVGWIRPSAPSLSRAPDLLIKVLRNRPARR